MLATGKYILTRHRADEGVAVIQWGHFFLWPICKGCLFPIFWEIHCHSCFMKMLRVCLSASGFIEEKYKCNTNKRSENQLRLYSDHVSLKHMIKPAKRHGQVGPQWGWVVYMGWAWSPQKKIKPPNLDPRWCLVRRSATGQALQMPLRHLYQSAFLSSQMWVFLFY